MATRQSSTPTHTRGRSGRARGPPADALLDRRLHPLLLRDIRIDTSSSPTRRAGRGGGGGARVPAAAAAHAPAAATCAAATAGA